VARLEGTNTATRNGRGPMDVERKQLSEAIDQLVRMGAERPGAQIAVIVMTICAIVEALDQKGVISKQDIVGLLTEASRHPAAPPGLTALFETAADLVNANFVTM